MKLRWCAPLLAFLVLAPFGCAPKGIHFPESGGPSWHEVVTSHFVVDTDLGDSDAADLASGLEQMYEMLRDVAFYSLELPAIKVRVFDVRDRAEFEEFVPRTHDGMFTRGGLNATEITPVVYVHGALLNETRATIRHELVHDFVRYYFPQAPRWLNEGLAKYYETLEIHNGEAVAGLIPFLGVVRGSGDAYHVSTTELPSVQELFSSDYRAFNPAVGDVNDAAFQAAMRGEHAYYGASWGLVHLCMENERYRHSFISYLSRLHDGDSHATAWQTSFNDEQMATIEADYRAFWNRRDTAVTKRGYVPKAVEANARILRPAEVRSLVGRLRPWSPTSTAKAEADLDAAIALDPKNPEPLTAKGKLSAFRAKNRQAGKVFFERALSLNPDFEDALVALRLAEEDEKIADDLLQRLSKVASQSRSFDLLAQHELAQHHPDAALELLKKAMGVDPLCVSCLDTAASALEAKGDVVAAASVERLAVNTLPDGAAPPYLTGRLRRYEVAASRLAPPSAQTDGKAAP